MRACSYGVAAKPRADQFAESFPDAKLARPHRIAEKISARARYGADVLAPRLNLLGDGLPVLLSPPERILQLGP